MRILPALLTTAVPLAWRLSDPCSMATPDPFRPQRPPLEPLAINAIQELLADGSSAETVAQKAIEVRALCSRMPPVAHIVPRVDMLHRRVPTTRITHSTLRKKRARVPPNPPLLRVPVGLRPAFASLQ